MSESLWESGPGVSGTAGWRVSPPENQPWTEEIEIRLGQRKIDILLVGSSIWDIKRYIDYIRFFFRSALELSSSSYDYDLLQMGTLWL